MLVCKGEALDYFPLGSHAVKIEDFKSACKREYIDCDCNPSG